MAKFFLRRIVSKLSPKLRQRHSLRDVLTLYYEGACADAYAILCEVMANQPQWSKDGDIYTLWAELELKANGDTCRAQELLNKARELGCSAMGYYYVVSGHVMWDKGDRERALQDYERSVAADPSVSNLTMLAQALFSMGDKRATSVWEQVLEKDPKNCLAHIHIGWEAAKSGDRGKALLMAKRAEKLNPSVQEVFEIGRLYHELEEFQTSINTYLEANSLGYDDKALLYASVAACYLSLGQATPAKKYAQWAVQCDPENDYVKEIWREYKERFGG